MKKFSKNLILSAIIATASLHSGTAAAEANLALQNPHYGEKGWDVEGVAVIGAISDWVYKTDDDEKNFFGIGFNVRYYGENMYFVADDEEGILLGYNLSKNIDSAFDVLLAPRFGGFEEDNKRLDHLDTRKVDLHAGARYTQYMGDSLYKIEFSHDISGLHNGSILSATYQKEWQQKNWVITGTASASYLSKKMMDYYFGVSNAEATAEFAAHDADAATLLTVGVTAEYPINEHWVFNTGAHYISSKEVPKSPITLDKDYISIVSVGINYHF